jgi:hypothetical protein
MRLFTLPREFIKMTHSHLSPLTIIISFNVYVDDALSRKLPSLLRQSSPALTPNSATEHVPKISVSGGDNSLLEDKLYLSKVK